MNRDEKSAFDAMLAEVEESDSDSELDGHTERAYQCHARGTRPSAASQAKATARAGGARRQGVLRPNLPVRPSTYRADLFYAGETYDRNEYAADAKYADEDAIDNFGRGMSFSLHQQGMRSPQCADTLPEAVEADRAATLKRWLVRPVAPEDGTLQCYVDRSRPAIAGVTGSTIYRMYLDDPDKPNSSKFFMAAKKKMGKGTSYYLVSAEMDPDDRGSNSVLGKVRRPVLSTAHRAQ